MTALHRALPQETDPGNRAGGSRGPEGPKTPTDGDRADGSRRNTSRAHNETRARKTTRAPPTPRPRHPKLRPHHPKLRPRHPKLRPHAPPSPEARGPQAKLRSPPFQPRAPRCCAFRHCRRLSASESLKSHSWTSPSPHTSPLGASPQVFLSVVFTSSSLETCLSLPLTL